MGSSRRRAEFGAALLANLIGACGALLISTRTWQTIVTPRQRPLGNDVLPINGRTVDDASTALALVALAGVVAVLATRGLGRRVIGAVLALAGAAVIWRAIGAASAVSAARARSLVRSRHSGVGVGASVVPRVSVHAEWPALTVVCGVLVLVAGLLILARGHRWAGMSARYEAPGTLSDVDAESARTRASASLWSALDHGEDPTGGADPAEASRPPPEPS